MIETIVTVVVIAVAALGGYILAKKLQPTIISSAPTTIGSETIADNTDKDADAKDKVHVTQVDATTLITELQSQFGASKSSGTVL
jgi:hypothetical protein